MLAINNENFNSEVLQSDKPVLVKFWATWCGPCRQQTPIVDQFANEHSEIKVVSLDVDEAREIANQYNVKGIPALLLFNNGQLVSFKSGLLPLGGIEGMLAAL